MAQPDAMTDRAAPGQASRRAAVLACGTVVCGLQIAFPQYAFLSLLGPPALIAASTSLPLLICLCLAVVNGLAPLLGHLIQPESTIDGTPASIIGSCVWSVGLVLSCFYGHYWRQRYRQSMRTDDLTGLANRRALREQLERECMRSRRTTDPLTLLFIDCDDFKTVNDAHGHVLGDTVLQTVAECLKTGTRDYDTVARFAGDEFMILCPGTDSVAAQNLAQRMMHRLRECMTSNNYNITFSMGVATFSEFEISVSEMIAIVDQTMYRTKHSSKDGISFT